MSKNQEYIEQYAEYAMEQMERYGIPASVTLAQGILESASGQSWLSRESNNHFGIKATPGWLKAGGGYVVADDDKPGEKFCAYADVGQSFEHHSQFLRQNPRYASLFDLPADDYRGWADGLQRAGYATNQSYAQSLQQIIERNGLARYDQMVMERMHAAGRDVGGTAQRADEITVTPTDAPNAAPQTHSSDDWLQQLLLMQQEGHDDESSSLFDMLVATFSALLAMSFAIDRQETQERNAMTTEARQRASTSFERQMADPSQLRGLSR